MMDSKARQDCIKEIDLLKQLNHPNVIKYYASFIENNEVDELYYYTMEFLYSFVKEMCIQAMRSC